MHARHTNGVMTPEHLRSALVALHDRLVDARRRALLAISQSPARAALAGDGLLRADGDAEQRMAVIGRAIRALDERAHDDIDEVRRLLQSIAQTGPLPLDRPVPATAH